MPIAQKAHPASRTCCPQLGNMHTGLLLALCLSLPAAALAGGGGGGGGVRSVSVPMAAVELAPLAALGAALAVGWRRRG